MNKKTVALCYPSQPSSTLLELVRAKTVSFGLRAEYLFESLAHTDSMGRSLLRLSRGYDLVIIVCNNTPRHSEYDVLGYFNHDLGDPWATCVLAIGSPEWRKPQPTAAIESSRYIGYFLSTDLTVNFFELLKVHRESLHNRGLSTEEWKSIKSLT